MNGAILLDTCAALWSVDGKLGQRAKQMIAEADQSSDPVLISPISGWEIGMLVAKGRIALPTSPDQWFSALLDEGVRLAPLDPTILIQSSFLPGKRLRDPADRILAATARAFNYRLMTRDRPLLEFASEGHMTAVEC